MHTPRNGHSSPEPARQPAATAGRLAVLLTVIALLAAACGTDTATPPVSASHIAVVAGETPEIIVVAPTAAAAPTSTNAGQPVPLLGALPLTGPDATVASTFQRVLDEAVVAGAPDMYASVITPGGTWTGAAGIGGLDARKATPSDSFYLGSLTKMFTSSLVMRLAESDRMDLDAPLAGYLGGLRVDSNHASVRQALGMVSGLPDYGPDAAVAISARPRHAWTVKEIAGYFGTPVAPAGAQYILAGPNYVLLAVAAEHAADTPFSIALGTYVLDPVSAERIVQQGPGLRTPRPWALPTREHMGTIAPSAYGADLVLSCMSSVSFSFGGGSMAGDVGSVARWTWHLFAGDVVGRRSLEAMLPAAGERHGLGIEALDGFGDQRAYGQTAGKTGYGAIVASFPDRQTVIAVFVNEQDYLVEPVVQELLDAAAAG